MVHQALRSALDALFPKRCAACDSPEATSLLCAPCAGSLIPGDQGDCPQCGAQDIESVPQTPVGLCGTCLSDPPAFQRARGAYAYGGALAHTIGRWKSRPDASLTRGVCELFREVPWEDWLEEHPTRIIFVPPDRRRMGRRGFHPAGLLARQLGCSLGVLVDPSAVGVSGPYESSRGQGRARRRERLRGVFSVEASRVRRERLVLVDDVMTTGATVDTIARACVRAGARSVQVAVLARAPR